jgi:hypothetical protein
LLREKPLYECVERAAHLFASGGNLRQAIEEDARAPTAMS